MGSLAPPPTIALAPGDRLDRYELLCVIAQGGMGAVWLARMTGKHGFERLVALKTILAPYKSDRQFCDMFLDEGRIASQIDHENVARILEIGEDRGILYHAMELIDGLSLRTFHRDVLGVGVPFPLPIALRIAADICAGLHAVHELNGADGEPLDVVHRDVSPQNILVTVRGTSKLIDFGVAKARERRSAETTAGTLKGKIEYMAPEQARCNRIDRRVDVYAVGAVLYELLAGEPVRNTADGRELLALHELMMGLPYDPLPDSVPLPVRTLVDRALAEDPADRYLTAEDMRLALEHVMITTGHMATTHDVAKVFMHYSLERLAERKEAIEGAVRAARSLEPCSEGQAVREPRATPANTLPLDGRPREAQGGTSVLDAHLPDVATVTGVSMQRAAISELPRRERPRTPTKTVIGIFLVLSLVAFFGATLGVVISRRAITSASATPVSTTLRTRSASPSSAAPSARPETASTVAEASVTTKPSLGANDGGGRPSASAKPVVKRPRTKDRAGGQPRSDSDEYGF